MYDVPSCSYGCSYKCGSRKHNNNCSSNNNNNNNNNNNKRLCCHVFQLFDTSYIRGHGDVQGSTAGKDNAYPRS